MKRINMNELAIKIAKQEGKRKSISIAQVKEVIRLVFVELANNHDDYEILQALERYVK